MTFFRRQASTINFAPCAFCINRRSENRNTHGAFLYNFSCPHHERKEVGVLPLRKIPRIFIAGTQSGSGKTALTCGIIAALKRRGLKVQAYKTGPDYIDPGYLTQAAGCHAHNLDRWLTDEETMTRIFCETSNFADISVVEGVMGLYDGGENSTAELAKILRSPVVLIVDAKSTGESAAATAVGFREYDSDVDLRGVILNRLGSESHRELITDAMHRVGIPVYGAVRRDDRFKIPERYLGLLPAGENCGLNFAHLAEIVEKSLDLDALLKIAASAPELDVPAAAPHTEGKRAAIAVARDEAFSFYYPESLAELERAGAELVFFSPLNDLDLPECGGLIFGGGFPEKFAARLAANERMKRYIVAAAERGMPIYAECGGYMYLTREISDFDGRRYPMTGLIPAACRMNEKLQTVGYVEATLLRDTFLAPRGTVVRAHEFHFSSVENGAEDAFAWQIQKNSTGARYNAGYASSNVLASYLHIHFAGNPQLARNFVNACARSAKM